MIQNVVFKIEGYNETMKAAFRVIELLELGYDNQRAI